MDPVFRRESITSITALLSELRPVRFPEAAEVSAKEVILLKRDIVRNCDLLIAYAYFCLRRRSMLSPDQVIILEQLLRDAHETKRQCGKVTVNFLRPRHRRILTNVRDAYEETRLAALLVCQQSEPALMDSLTVSL